MVDKDTLLQPKGRPLIFRIKDLQILGLLFKPQFALCCRAKENVPPQIRFLVPHLSQWFGQGPYTRLTRCVRQEAGTTPQYPAADEMRGTQGETNRGNQRCRFLPRPAPPPKKKGCFYNENETGGTAEKSTAQ